MKRISYKIMIYLKTHMIQLFCQVTVSITLQNTDNMLQSIVTSFSRLVGNELPFLFIKQSTNPDIYNEPLIPHLTQPKCFVPICCCSLGTQNTLNLNVNTVHNKQMYFKLSEQQTYLVVDTNEEQLVLLISHQKNG